MLLITKQLILFCFVLLNIQLNPIKLLQRLNEAKARFKDLSEQAIQIQSRQQVSVTSMMICFAVCIMYRYVQEITLSLLYVSRFVLTSSFLTLNSNYSFSFLFNGHYLFFRVIFKLKYINTNLKGWLAGSSL